MRLRLEGISTAYGGRGSVLEGIDFEFSRGGIYVITGDNGAGKSTLLRICALLQRPDNGRVAYLEGGAPLPHDMALKRRITLLLPRLGLFSASAAQNVAYPLKLRGVDKAELEKMVSSALDGVGLLGLAGQNALTLSSGEAQRLALARAMVFGPDVLMLDEPTASVDRQSVEVIETAVKKFTLGGRMVILTTHDHDQARRLASVGLELDGGRLTRNPTG